MVDKKQESSTVSELNRGGQVLMHFIRMLHQTLARYVKIIMLVYAVSAGLMTYRFTDTLDWYMGLKYYYSSVFVHQLGMENGKASLRLPNGRVINVTDKQIVNSPAMQAHAEILYSNLLKSLLFSALIALIAAWYLFKFVLNKGKEERKDEHLRGAEIVAFNDLVTAAEDRIREDGRPSRISIANIPLIRYQENSGIALIGSPGTGKSTTTRDILRQIRAKSQKAVLYDISGEFTKRFYRPGKDVILNVFDTRSHRWDFWAEGKNPAMYDRLAKAAIPDNNAGGDPFWTEAPRLLFSALLEQLGRRFEVPQVEHLMNIILRMPNDKIAKVVATTDARNVMNLELDKLAGSVRAVITAYTRNFKHLALPTGPRFSFREWAQDEDSDTWVFITVRDDMKDTLKPMMTMMIESALSAILTLETSQSRLIATGIDEAGTLHEIPTAVDYVSTCRKFGGIPILGFQSPAQLEQIYGKNKAQVLMDSIGTLAAFRINGSEGAAWLANQLGDQEIEKPAENTSFGANDVRDATTINRASKEQNIILKSQITELPDNTCYLRLGRGMPVAKIKFPFDNMEELHPGIIEAKVLKTGSFMSNFTHDNDVTPEAVLAAVHRDMDSAELQPQKPKGIVPPDSDNGKSKGQLLDEVINQITGDAGVKKVASEPNTTEHHKESNEPAPAATPVIHPAVNPVVQAMATGEVINPVAQAMLGGNSENPPNEETDDDSDFDQMNAENEAFFHQLMEQYNSHHGSDKPGDTNIQATEEKKNTEISMNHPDLNGGGF
ncbi:type IV secretion system DNA-binding domain-containing protein [Salmonella enterica subsp. enterica serovar Enteritidis]|nr:type IV secretion system DNA-binding domain-containing protein [Salmonella enterica subsp. enterica serovar Enteritidis]